jgi:hypothetical protein
MPEDGQEVSRSIIKLTFLLFVMPFSIPVLATAQNMAGVLPPQPSSIDTSKGFSK